MFVDRLSSANSNCDRHLDNRLDLKLVPDLDVNWDILRFGLKCHRDAKCQKLWEQSVRTRVGHARHWDNDARTFDKCSRLSSFPSAMEKCPSGCLALIRLTFCGTGKYSCAVARILHDQSH